MQRFAADIAGIQEKLAGQKLLNTEGPLHCIGITCLDVSHRPEAVARI